MRSKDVKRCESDAQGGSAVIKHIEGAGGGQVVPEQGLTRLHAAGRLEVDGRRNRRFPPDDAPSANLMYLGTSVLILLDLSFISRFWTQFESWLALQQPTTGGLRRALGTEKRETFVPIYNGTPTAVKLLEEQWEGKSVLEAKAILAKPDVTVTNQSDKEMQLVKLEQLDGLVKQLNKGTALVLGIARAVGPVGKLAAKRRAGSWRASAIDENGRRKWHARERCHHRHIHWFPTTALELGAVHVWGSPSGMA